MKKEKTEIGKIQLIKPLIEELKLKDCLALKGMDYKSLKKRLNDVKNPDKTFLIRMKLINGFWTTFTISTEEPYFRYDERRYIIDADFLEYDVASKLWGCTYHQSISIPIKLTMPVRELKDAIMRGEKPESKLTMHPNVLDEVIEADFVKKVIAGQKLADTITILKQWVLYNLIASGLTLGFLLFKFGGFVK